MVVEQHNLVATRHRQDTFTNTRSHAINNVGIVSAIKKKTCNQNYATHSTFYLIDQKFITLMNQPAFYLNQHTTNSFWIFDISSLTGRERDPEVQGVARQLVALEATVLIEAVQLHANAAKELKNAWFSLELNIFSFTLFVFNYLLLFNSICKTNCKNGLAIARSRLCTSFWYQFLKFLWRKVHNLDLIKMRIKFARLNFLFGRESFLQSYRI